MKPFRIAHEYDAAPAEFWNLFFDPAYSRAFYDSVNIDFEVLRDQAEGTRRERVVRYRSRDPVPMLLRRFLPDGLGYVEHATFDEASCTFEHRIEPTAFGSRTDIRATLCAEDLGQGRMRRIYAGTVAVHVPLLSDKIESDTIASMTKAQETAARVTREWLVRLRQRNDNSVRREARP